MEEWIKRIDALRDRVEKLAKLSLKDKQFDSFASHPLFNAARELDEAQTELETKMVRAARPSVQRKRRRKRA